MPADRIVTETESKMKKTLEVLQNELKTLRTAKASTALVENIKADFYGTPTPLKQMAVLAAPQPDMIVIKPFDPSSIKEIEKAIKNSDLSLAPIVDGKLVRLSIPPLTEERRRQLVGQVKQIGEQAKIGIRNIRRDANKHIETEEKGKLITEDDRKKGNKQIDDITKKYTDEIDHAVKHKSDEIMLD